MTSRILPPSEWARLAGTEAEPIVPGLDPATTAVVVVEDAGQIIGAWLALRMTHVECLWVAPAHRGRAGVVRRLLRTMRDVVTQWGTPCPVTGAVTPEMSDMIRRMGGIPLPGEHFALPLGSRACPQ